MTTNRYTPQVANDAGLLREYVARNYGAALTYGALSQIYFRASRLVRRLARMAGITYEEALAAIRADFEIIEMEEA